MKSNIVFGLICITLTSCAAEVVDNSSSPLTEVILQSKAGSLSTDVNSRLSTNINAAEINNLIGSFPKIKNDAVNNEVVKLKGSLKNYLLALNSYNLVERQKALNAYQKSYKKIQGLRKFLNSDDDSVINRYLVRFKTNIENIEATFDDSSISTIK